jgi:hypothetical protein
LFFFSFVYDENNTEICFLRCVIMHRYWRDQKHNLNLSMTRLGIFHSVAVVAVRKTRGSITHFHVKRIRKQRKCL